MKGNGSFNCNYAVSEMVGGMILVLVAVMTFSLIYAYFLYPAPDVSIPVSIDGYVDDSGDIVLEHGGGSSLDTYEIVLFNHPSNEEIGRGMIRGDDWRIGYCRYPFELLSIEDVKLLTPSDMVHCYVFSYDENNNDEQVFSGILSGKPLPLPGLHVSDMMLITSLRGDTTDEDLICFTYKVNTTLNVTSYIFKWMLDGQGLAQVLMPFDVDYGNVAKDYSDNEINGTVSGPTWNESGVVGGCYDFDGAGDSIDTAEVPEMFQDISRGDCTVSIWIKSYDVTDDNNVIFEVCDNYPGFKNYIRMFQFGSELHMAVLESSVMHVVRTDNISSNTWYHVAGTWDASTEEAAIYLNGVRSTKIGNREPPFGSQDGMSLGHGSASSPFWYGQLDEFQIFDRVLSDEQIYYLYLTQKHAALNISMIAAQETDLGDIWQCQIIPTDGTQEDEAYETNTLQIIGYGGGE
jgi:hypothetical protein